MSHVRMFLVYQRHLKDLTNATSTKFIPTHTTTTMPLSPTQMPTSAPRVHRSEMPDTAHARSEDRNSSYASGGSSGSSSSADLSSRGLQLDDAALYQRQPADNGSTSLAPPTCAASAALYFGTNTSSISLDKLRNHQPPLHQQLHGFNCFPMVGGQTRPRERRIRDRISE